MLHLQRAAGTILVIILGVSGNNLADEPQLSPHPGVLVLRSGRVLRGNITQVGDRFLVTLGQHDEVGVPIGVVEMRCNTLEEAYCRKRDNLPPTSGASAHLELGDWCLRYELIPAAAEQLMAAQRLDPENPANEIFERRLRVTARRAPAPTAPKRNSKPAVTPAELDELIGRMPDGTLLQFTNVIQPLLINRCGGCHGSNSKSAFQLLRLAANQSLPRRFTQRNLHAVMSVIDKEQVDHSPLIRMSRIAHGGSEKPAFDERDGAQLERLTNWAFQAANRQRHKQPIAINSPPNVLLHSGKPSASASQQDLPIDNSPPLQPGSNRADRTANRSAAPAADPSRASSDPFDPEVFNRRFLKR